MPSKNESFGLAALEAMSCGVPVIASNIGGIPEVVEHNKTGFLSDVGDIEEMAENAVRLLKDKDLHQNFAIAARDMAVSEFSDEQIIKQYEKLYYSC